MKFKAKSACKSTVEYFSKRGIGWHGCALIYYFYQQQDENGNIEYNEQAEEVMVAKKNILYIDQILEGSNEQYGLVVISVMEIAITTIQDQLSFISSTVEPIVILWS